MEPARRVLILSWEFPPRIVGGISRHVHGISRALAELGTQVDVLTAHHPGSPEREEMAVGEGRLRVLRANPPPIDPLDFVCGIHHLDFGLLERLLREDAHDYDLIHAHDWLVAFAARTLKHGLGVPLVATMHATEAGRNQGIHTPEQHYIHSVEWMLTYDAWRVICCSQAMASEVRQALSVPPDKVRVVPNGIDAGRMACPDSADDLALFRRRWALDSERIILFVGRLVREKGVEVLIDAMPRVVAACPEARAIVVGGGGSEGLAQRAKGAGVGEKMVFAGFLPDEDLARLYRVADVAVFPSLYEPFGIVVLEALAAGVPVVTSDIGGFREIVRHNETGIHTWADNPESLAWGICRVLSDPALAARLGSQGPEEVRQRYAWGGIAERTMGVYDEVVKGVHEGGAQQADGPAGPGVRARYLGADGSLRRS